LAFEVARGCANLSDATAINDYCGVFLQLASPVEQSIRSN